MEVNAYSSSNAVNNTAATAQRTPGKLDQDAFLKILTAQLSNQNPMEPTSDTEFIAQLAQFSMLEQLQNMSSSFATSQAYDLLGKYVYIDQMDDTTGEVTTISGTVDGIIKQDGIDYLVVDNERYLPTDVTAVLDKAPEPSIDPSMLENSSLLGKLITASWKSESGEVETVQGIVDKLTLRDDVIYAQVNDQEVNIAHITEIAQPESGAAEGTLL